MAIYAPIVGLLGVGHLGEAIASGLLGTGTVNQESLLVFDTKGSVPESFSAMQVGSERDIAARCNVVFLCVPPSAAKAALAAADWKGKAMVSTVAGLSSETIARWSDARAVRIMPNMPIQYYEGAIAYEEPNVWDAAEKIWLVETLNRLGTAVPVRTDQFDIVTGLSGSGPAYGYALIEAMETAGAQAGLAKESARLLAAQTLLGAAKTVLESTQDPQTLIDAVATKGGTTEAGVRALEEYGFSDAVVKAVQAAQRRSAELSGS